MSKQIRTVETKQPVSEPVIGSKSDNLAKDHTSEIKTLSKMAVSGDGMGDFKVADNQQSTADERAAFEAISEQNGMATMVSKATHAKYIAAICALFKKSVDTKDKYNIESVLIYFFGAHGTSPDTAWTSYEQKIIWNGIAVPPSDVIRIVGLHNLKKFLGHYSARAIAAVQVSPSFREALAERAARANLPPGQEYMAIDFVGKDGKLSAEQMSTRVVSKDRLLNHRSRNANNLSTVRHQENASNLLDVRSAGANNVMSFDH